MAKATGTGFNWLGLPVIATVARLLCRELTLQNEYLRTENAVLKSKIKGRIRFTDDERRSLVDAAVALGRKLMREVVRIVKPETILAWQRRLEKQKWDYSSRRQRGPGRPRMPRDIESLVFRMARDNTWGYKRIQGELLKLDVKLSKGCNADILRRHSLPPSLERKGLSWREFLSRHAEVMLCTYLFTKEIWTFCGLKTAYVLFVLHLETRRVILAEATFCPHGRWMSQMARNVLMACDDLGIAPQFLLHDRDGLFIHDFDRRLKAAGVGVVKTPFQAPNANACAERWVLSAKVECLDHLVLFGLGSLRRAISCYRAFFNDLRPHQGIGNRIPKQRADGGRGTSGRSKALSCASVQRAEFLGGLLKSYSREAA